MVKSTKASNYLSNVTKNVISAVVHAYPEVLIPPKGWGYGAMENKNTECICEYFSIIYSPSRVTSVPELF